MSHKHHHDHPNVQKVLDAMEGVAGLTRGLDALVGRLSSTRLLDDAGVVRQ
jgi:hypothetical protein